MSIVPYGWYAKYRFAIRYCPLLQHFCQVQFSLYLISSSKKTSQLGLYCNSADAGSTQPLDFKLTHTTPPSTFVSRIKTCKTDPPLSIFVAPGSLLLLFICFFHFFSRLFPLLGCRFRDVFFLEPAIHCLLSSAKVQRH